MEFTTPSEYSSHGVPARVGNKKIFLIITIIAISIFLLLLVSLIFEYSPTIKIPGMGIITSLGLEVYEDPENKNMTEFIEWGEIFVGSTNNITLYIRNISNDNVILNFETTNWLPINISQFMNVFWNYNRTTINPGEIIEVKITLSASYSLDFIEYLLANNNENFSFDIIIIPSRPIK